MKKKGNLKENLVAVLEVPRDLAYRDAIITVTGPGFAVIENYRSILKYTREEIVVLTLRGKVAVQGKRLEIPCYTPDEMQVCGCISGIFFDRQ